MRRWPRLARRPLQVVDRTERSGGCGGMQSLTTFNINFRVDLVYGFHMSGFMTYETKKGLI